MITLRKRISNLGGSRAVVIPKEWLDHWEREHGPFDEVDIELGEALIIKPVFSDDGHKEPVTV